MLTQLLTVTTAQKFPPLELELPHSLSLPLSSVAGVSVSRSDFNACNHEESFVINVRIEYENNIYINSSINTHKYTIYIYHIRIYTQKET